MMFEQFDDSGNLDTPVICLTANAISGARQEYIAAGFNDYLTKPIDPDTLENKMIDYLADELIEPASEDSKTSAGSTLSSDDTGLPEELSLLADQNLIDINLGLVNSGSAESYLSLLGVFYSSVQVKSEELNRLYSEEDYKNYTIKVHALKSSARIIGAMEFGEEAQRLEDAGKAGDHDYIRSHHDGFMAEFDTLCNLIEAAVRKENNSPDKPTAEPHLMEEAYSLIDEAAFWQKLKNASDSFEYDTIVSLLEERQ